MTEDTIKPPPPVKCDKCGRVIGAPIDIPHHICGLQPKDYRDAILVQSACNLGAVVRSFGQVIKKIQYEGRGKGTDWVNEHPIVKLYVEQLKHLSSLRSYSDAYDICMERNKEEYK